jgi:hypothetical protein
MFIQPYGDNSFSDVIVQPSSEIAADHMMNKKLPKVSSATSSEALLVNSAAGTVPDYSSVKCELDQKADYDSEIINLDGEEALEAEEQYDDEDDFYETDCFISMMILMPSMMMLDIFHLALKEMFCNKR